MKTYLLAAAILLTPMTARAADYDVDLGMLSDMEDIRILIDRCSDIGELEDHRDALESVRDLESLRSFLQDLGYVEFRGCPAGVEGIGIEWVY